MNLKPNPATHFLLGAVRKRVQITEDASQTKKGFKQATLVFENSRFLIVDDELANVRLLEEMLRQWGCKHFFSTTDDRRR